MTDYAVPWAIDGLRNLIYTIGKGGAAMTEAQKAAQKKYVSEKTITVQVRFRIQKEDDLIRWLDRQSNKTAYIKRLIWEDMNFEKKCLRSSGI